MKKAQENQKEREKRDGVFHIPVPPHPERRKKWQSMLWLEREKMERWWCLGRVEIPPDIIEGSISTGSKS